ncbi:MAG TPA: hypothetical protein VF791_00455 [Pyrinomonadaceae bacterium]
MKGGITSGIIYPPLVLKLKDYYRFRSVGGTSAGAIAAAVTAAAEYGRSSGGFEELEKVNNQLKNPKFLQKLFQPAGNARPLMETLLDLSEFHKTEKGKASGRSAFKKLRVYVAGLKKTLLETNPKGCSRGRRRGLFYALLLTLAISLVAFLIALVVSLLLAKDGSLLFAALTFVLTFLSFGTVLALLGFKYGGLAQGIADLAMILFRKVPKDNFFGICNGRTDKKGGGNQPGERQEALTDWLSSTINKLAGRKPEHQPLTFGELWEPKDEKGNKRIDLRMVTSNLSQNQPYILPFEQNLFIFRKSDFEVLFPATVVNHMIEHQRECSGFDLPEGYHFLPSAKDLPVVVATRMSLSFPLLISMVPLYTLSHNAFGHTKVGFNFLTETDQQKELILLNEIHEQNIDGRSRPYTRIRKDRTKWPTVEEQHLQPNWFSDGGICSNFPMHFFDSWLPSRPTFGVNLTSQSKDPMETGGEAESFEKVDKGRFSYCGQQLSPETARAALDEDVYNEDVFLPRPENDPSPEWVPIESIGAMLGAIFRTAQNYRDNMQAALPSYRERIVQIRLTPEEGGLNLAMDSETIERVFEKGLEAGDALINKFEFDVHQWIRFLVLMNQIEKSLTKMSRVLNDSEFYLETLRDETEDSRASRFPYGRDTEWLGSARARVEAMNQIIAEWGNEVPSVVFADDAPRPESVLRVTPVL